MQAKTERHTHERDELCLVIRSGHGQSVNLDVDGGGIGMDWIGLISVWCPTNAFGCPPASSGAIIA